jgi:energy-converting hydrogenase Eha subunit G
MNFKTLLILLLGCGVIGSGYTGGEIINGLAHYDFAALWKIRKDKAVFTPFR